MKQKVKTISHTCKVWEAELYISLLMGDGGGDFEEEEIKEAEEFISENRIFNITEVSEPSDGEVKCTFIIN